MKKLVLFASGEGSTIQAVLDAIRKGTLQSLKPVYLITDRGGIGALDKALEAGIPAKVVPPEDEKIYEETLTRLLLQLSPDLILLAGYLRKIPPSVVAAYQGKMMNTHPSLLPKYGGRGFYGNRIHETVIASGDKETGCTIHYVSEEYDQGEVIAQIKIPVAPSDTAESLAEKVKREEKKLLIQTLKELFHPNPDQTG